jgi:hypothetical protein
MKTAHQLFACFFCILPTIVSADTINGANILSQSYSVSGSYQYSWYQDTEPMGPSLFGFSSSPNPSNLYMTGSSTFGGSSNDGTPLSVGVATPSPASIPPNSSGFSTQNGIYSSLWVNTSINTFNFQSTGYALQATGEYNILGADGLYYNTGYGSGGNGPIINNSAQASWLFQPTSDNLQILLNWSQNTGGYEAEDQQLSVTLTDVTDMNTLVDYNGTGELNGGSSNYAFSLNSDDQYQLSVTSTSSTFDSDQLEQDFSASIEPVPEPSVFLLFPLAVATFIGSRIFFCSKSYCSAARTY